MACETVVKTLQRESAASTNQTLLAVQALVRWVIKLG